MSNQATEPAPPPCRDWGWVGDIASLNVLSMALHGHHTSLRSWWPPIALYECVQAQCTFAQYILKLSGMRWKAACPFLRISCHLASYSDAPQVGRLVKKKNPAIWEPANIYIFYMAFGDLGICMQHKIRSWERSVSTIQYDSLFISGNIFLTMLWKCRQRVSIGVYLLLGIICNPFAVLFAEDEWVSGKSLRLNSPPKKNQINLSSHAH